jgi:broad specificity phosphatase PhoE
MPLVLLVRHGQASAHADDYDVLSDVGHRQSELVGAELRRRGLRDPLVLSGDLRRQRDTAAAAMPGAEVRVDARWDEYDHLRLLAEHGDPGGWDGTPRGLQTALDAALARWVAAEDPDGWPAFRHRVVTALEDLVTSLPSGRDAVVFTSGGVVAAVAAELLGAGGPSVVALNRVTVNTGITRLLAGSSGVSLSAFNEHAHLDGEHRSLLTYR